ncbi:hypothetical protein [Actinomyces naeslundii]|uniref:Uncharacterized protein n=1 Tax=Actinomyces naeslundii TaxID=1655 RepID=A0AA47IKS5_ACTNA|nr:hypothetical protein [Actinomyces naeslundii]WAL41822.1 hypothetical protein OFA60_06965 [Actinomyces naeslundii]
MLDIVFDEERQQRTANAPEIIAALRIWTISLIHHTPSSAAPALHHHRHQPPG